MRVPGHFGILAMALTVFSASAMGRGQAPEPSEQREASVIAVSSMSPTVLMASDATRRGALKVRWPGPVKKFWVENWTTNLDSFTWTVYAPRADVYSVSIIIVNCGKAVIDCKQAAPSPVKIEIASGLNKIDYSVVFRDTSPATQWMREELKGALRLPAGTSKVTLRAKAADRIQPFNLALLSVELEKLSAKKAMEERALKVRSSTSWMIDGKYGLMFTWSAASQPRSGLKKPYAEAVQDFDVKAFADMVAKTGAGFVVFATSWADYYFPAPINAIDRILSGRTTKRDLINDLADALNARGIKLMIYYHAGHGDKEWWAKTGFQKLDKTDYFNGWEAIISEIGLRYGTKLAGFWFDDGMAVYYPATAPWEQMTIAAKAGNPARVVGYNSWIWPKATDFQDFYCGESELSDDILSGDKYLPVGGSGRFTGGPESGLQATITARNESGDWGHTKVDTEVQPPMLSTTEMIDLLRKSATQRVVPVINLEVYQDGTPSPQAIEEFTAIREAIKASKQ